VIFPNPETIPSGFQDYVLSLLSKISLH